MSRIWGIIPAAGRSRRMGRPKPALPIGGRPMLHHVAEAMLAAPQTSVVIVVNEGGLDVARPLADRCEILVNPRPEAAMIESIQLAIRHIHAQCGPGGEDGYLVCPSDAAGVSAETLRVCVDAFRREPTRIVIASHGGKRGHPIVFACALSSEVLSLAPTEGLNVIPRRHAAEVLELACEDPAVLRNINTPDDYDRLAK